MSVLTNGKIGYFKNEYGILKRMTERELCLFMSSNPKPTGGGQCLSRVDVIAGQMNASLDIRGFFNLTLELPKLNSEVNNG
ncbi:MAG: hypothetical protein WC356_02030 [Candidatus Micrarchaeia archaeon]|jgi:hypothetical protein